MEKETFIQGLVNLIENNPVFVPIILGLGYIFYYSIRRIIRKRYPNLRLKLRKKYGKSTYKIAYSLIIGILWMAFEQEKEIKEKLEFLSDDFVYANVKPDILLFGKVFFVSFIVLMVLEVLSNLYLENMKSSKPELILPKPYVKSIKGTTPDSGND